MRERLTSEPYIGLLVALLSIATAFTAYLGYRADARAGELDLNATKTLTESNTEFLRSNQEVMLDYAAYDNFVVGGAEDPELADFYRDGFSLELDTAMEREAGPFDDVYFDEMFSEADLLYDEALDLFDAGAAAGEEADGLQLLMLFLAVGLSLGAYASLGDRKGRIALLFSVLATLVLVIGAVALGVMLLA